MPMILPELKWMLIGEKLSESGMVMYRDVWDYTPPLAVWAYKWLHVIFGRSVIPFQIFSILLVIYQAGVFNNIMLNNKAYNQNTYVPAFIYIIVMNSFFDFMTLSPVLMSMTFNLLAMNHLFKRMDNTTRDELFTVIGIYFGLATLFFLPSILFFLVTIFSLIIYTGSIVRRMLLMIYGFGMVLVLCSLYFYWYDGALFYHQFFYASLFSVSATDYLSFGALMVALIIPIAVFLFSMVKMVQDGRYINYQVKIQYVMFFFILAGVISLFMVKEFSTFQLIIFMPSLAFFITHYILTIRHWIIAEGSAGLIVMAMIMNLLMTYNGWLIYEKYMSYEGLYVKESASNKLLEGKKVLIIGEELSPYQNSSLATPFLNWQLSAQWLENPNYYDNITLIYQKMTNDLPEVIVDKKQVMSDVLDAMPTISAHYQIHNSSDDLNYVKSD